MQSIAVVIPCYNEENYLGLLLDDLAAQTEAPQQVIIADSNSTDKSVAVAKEYKKRLPLKVITTKQRSPGAARNAGAQVSSSDYLLFIDADIRIPKDLIEKVGQAFTDKVDLISVKYQSDGGHTADSYLFWIINLNSWLYARLKLAFAIGGVLGIRKSLHVKVGGFHETRQANNDIDYMAKVRKLKPDFRYLVSIRVTHSSRRYAGKNLITSLLTLLRENSILGRLILQPLLSKAGRGKKYGHHL